MMKKFSFKLQKLLDFRETKEKEVKNELSKVLMKQNIERNKQQELQQGIDKEKIVLKARMVEGKAAVNEVMMFEKYIDMSLKAIDVAGRKIQEIEPEFQEVRSRLIEATREKKIVEKLKEKRHDEYLYEFNREIAKENDDMNQKIFFRNKDAIM
jgi:flagellar FliJ protein